MSTPIQAGEDPRNTPVPLAVENTVRYNADGSVDWQGTLNNSFIYAPGFKAGDALKPGEGSMSHALNAEVASGAITADQARQSASVMGLQNYVVGTD